MADSAHTHAREWQCQWQEALVQAVSPERTVKLTRGELLRTGENGALAIPGEFFGDEVVLGDEVKTEHHFVTSTPRRGTASWLRWLVGHASSAQERLDIACMIPVTLLDEHLVQSRLEQWANYTIDRQTDTFGRYLSLEGLDVSAARRAVGPVQLREGAALPAWAETLGEAAFFPSYDELPGACDPIHPIPFETLLLPFLHIYHRGVAGAASAGYTCLKPEAQHTLTRHLLRRLSALAWDVLYAEFCRYRITNFAPLAPFVWGEPDALYRRFVRHMQSGGMLALFEAYPVLGRRLAGYTDHYAAAVVEFLHRLVADLPAIMQMWETADPDR